MSAHTRPQVCPRTSCSWFCPRGNGKRSRNGFLRSHGRCELRERLGWIPSWSQSHTPWCQRICAQELQTWAHLDHTLLLYGSIDVTDFLLSPSCSHFPVPQSTSPARVKPWRMGQTTGLSNSWTAWKLCKNQQRFQPWKCLEWAAVPGRPEEAGDCDLCLLPGACTFSIPHIDPSSVLQSQEIKIPARFLELSAPLRKEHGKHWLFGAYRNPSQIHLFS